MESISIIIIKVVNKVEVENQSNSDDSCYVPGRGRKIPHRQRITF